MNISFSLQPLVLALAAGLVTHGVVRAQDSDESNKSGYFLRLGGSARFNVQASITGTRPTLGPGIYDDGFILPDVGGIAAGKTWNWSYDSTLQIQGNQLWHNRLDNVPTIGHRDINLSNPALGAEFIGGYHFHEFKLWKKPARFAIELGYGFSEFSQAMNFKAAGAAMRTTARQNLGILPPVAPYVGTAEGPGPLINLNPGTSLVSDPAGGTTTSFQGTLENGFHEFRFGPSLELDLTKRFSVALGAGYSSIYTAAAFKYVETVSFNNPAINNPSIPAIAPSRGNVTKGAWHPGLYAELLLNYRITDHIGVFLGGDFHYNNQFTFGNAAYQVKLDLGTTYGAKAGLNVGF